MRCLNVDVKINGAARCITGKQMSALLKFRDCSKDVGVEGGSGMQLNLINVQVHSDMRTLKGTIKIRSKETRIEIVK